jgi:hypothetical protein
MYAVTIMVAIPPASTNQERQLLTRPLRRDIASLVEDKGGAFKELIKETREHGTTFCDWRFWFCSQVWLAEVFVSSDRPGARACK